MHDITVPECIPLMLCTHFTLGVRRLQADRAAKAQVDPAAVEDPPVSVQEGRLQGAKHRSQFAVASLEALQ